MTEKDLIRVLRDSVDDVRLSPSARENIRIKTNGGHSMKSKWKVGLVLAIALLLATAMAGAWSLSREFFEKTAELQYESGYYDDWSLEEKRGFVDIMAEYGLVDKAMTRELKDRNEEALDAWMADRYGINGRTDVIGLTSIAEKELGEMLYWPNETWVWFNQIELRMGQLSSLDPRICVTPGEEAVTPEEAIRAAQEAIEADGGPSVQELKAAKVYWTYEIMVDDEARENARYYIRFELADGSNLWAEVLRNGTVEVLEGISLSGDARQDGQTETLTERIWAIERTYRDDNGLSDYWYGWSLEDRAALAELQAPLYREAILQGDEALSIGGIHAMVYTYGTPDEKAIPQEQAQALARQAIVDSGLPEDVAAHYVNDGHPYYYYTRGAAPDGHPAWEFGFWYDEEDTKGQALSLSVQIDAWTGETLQCTARTLAPISDARVEAVLTLLEQKGAPDNWTDEEWNEYLPWPRE